MTSKAVTGDSHGIQSRILAIRKQKVILDRDLAALYGVSTSRFNEAVRRNRRRFPDDFAFQLTREELTDLMSQFAISSPGHGGIRKLPWAFTEHGAVMAANVLRSERAVQMSVFVVRAFVKMRDMLTAQKDLARRLAALEKTLAQRLDLHERVISDIIQQIMSLLNPPPEPESPRKQIGFHARERLAIYKVNSKQVSDDAGTKAGRPMKSGDAKARMGPFARSVGRALRRAAKVARETARAHHTPLYVWRNGKVVAKKP